MKGSPVPALFVRVLPGILVGVCVLLCGTTGTHTVAIGRFVTQMCVLRYGEELNEQRHFHSFFTASQLSPTLVFMHIAPLEIIKYRFHSLPRLN